MSQTSSYFKRTGSRWKGASGSHGAEGGEGFRVQIGIGESGSDIYAASGTTLRKYESLRDFVGCVL
jgi:hypothetical protein